MHHQAAVVAPYAAAAQAMRLEEPAGVAFRDQVARRFLPIHLARVRIAVVLHPIKDVRGDAVEVVLLVLARLERHDVVGFRALIVVLALVVVPEGFDLDGAGDLLRRQGSGAVLVLVAP